MTTHILGSMIAFTMKLIFFKEVTFLKEKGRDESKPFFFFLLGIYIQWGFRKLPDQTVLC